MVTERDLRHVQRVTDLRGSALFDDALAVRIHEALQTAGIVDQDVDASVGSDLEVMEVQLRSSGAIELGIEHLAVVAAILRSTEADDRIISVQLS